MKDLRAIRVIPNTKISHDYSGDKINTFSYYDLCERGTEAVGIPARQNGLIIVDIDVPGERRKVDGRHWWTAFCQEHNIPKTYTVGTPSGGEHYYFQLPITINEILFNPPARLAEGVDLKWNGWVKLHQLKATLFLTALYRTSSKLRRH
jgi:hypothetical protein